MHNFFDSVERTNQFVAYEQFWSPRTDHRFNRKNKHISVA